MVPHILVVDDDTDFRDTMIDWLTMSGYRVTGAANGREALARLRESPTDVIVTDLRMPFIGGMELLTLIKDWDSQVEVIFLTGQGTMHEAIHALREGRAFDFLEKPLGTMNDLNVVIERALNRRGIAVGRVASLPGPAEVGAAAVLTERETVLLRMLAAGMDNKQIAEHLGFSEGTIRNGLSRLYEKVGVTNRTQAALYVSQQNRHTPP